MWLLKVRKKSLNLVFRTECELCYCVAVILSFLPWVFDISLNVSFWRNQMKVSNLKEEAAKAAAKTKKEKDALANINIYNYASLYITFLLCWMAAQYNIYIYIYIYTELRQKSLKNNRKKYRIFSWLHENYTTSLQTKVNHIINIIFGC